MTLTQLKWFRVLVPGSLITVLGSQLLTSLDLVAAWTAVSSGPYAVLAIVAGALYDAVDFREYILKPHRTTVDDNIKQGLLALCAKDKQLEPNTLESRRGRALMQIFYGLVDNDKTLSEKAKLVYFNGLMWSTAADVVVIGFVFAVVNLIGAVLSSRADHLLATVLLSGAVVVAHWGLLPAATRQHVRTSNEQLEFIALHLCDKVCPQVRSQFGSV